MKNLKISFAAIAIFAMLFTSCSKEETSIDDPSAKATLSFGAALNDLAKQATATKQQAQDDFPECSDDAPAYVHVVLEGDENVGTIGDPLMIPVNDTPFDEDGDGVAEYFTEESSELELTPGSYELTYFAVYNDADELIWLAPTGDGDFAEWVDTALPLDISLGAGVKKYVDVDVLCFDNRMVNQYGYLFFDIIGTEAYEFCLFANYCPPNGRHYPAYYSVDVYLGTDDTGDLLYEGLTPDTDLTGEDPSAEPVCFALPNIASFDDDEDYIYWEATVLDWDDVYGEAEAITLSGTLSRNDIEANFDGDNNVDYTHLRFGCEDDGNGPPQDDDGDGVPNEDDECPNTPPNTPVDDDGCPIDDNGNGNGDDCETAIMFGNHTYLNDEDDLTIGNNWGWAQEFVEAEDGEYTFAIHAAAGQNNYEDNGWLAGEVTVTIDGENVEVAIVMEDDVDLEEVHIYFENEAPDTTAPGQYGNTDEDPDDDGETYNFTDADGSFWLVVHTVACQ